MEITHLSDAPRVQRESNDHRYWWSFKEAGHRALLSDEQAGAIGLPAGERWALSEVRCDIEGTYRWIVARSDGGRGEKLAFGRVDSIDGIKAVDLAVENREDKDMLIGLAKL